MFCSGDNLALFDPDKFLNIRMGQIPLLGFDHLIDNDPKLNEQQNFARRERAGNIAVFAARLFGKCNAFGSKVLLENNRLEKIENLIGTKQNVLTLNEKTHKLVKTEAKFYDNGVRKCVELRLKNNKATIVTENHPFLTKRGWVEIINLKLNDLIAIPDWDNYKNNNNEKDVIWAEIKTIKYVGQFQTVAVYVPGYHNYIADDIISHNTFVVEELDFNQYAVCCENERAGFTSFDYTHLKGVLDKMYLVWENHPIISAFKERVIRGDYQFVTKFGITIQGINMKVSAGSSAGDGFFQLHLKRLWIEENSKESDIVYEKRADSISEIGCIAENEKVLLKDFTTKSIQDVEIGEEILGWDEENSTVTISTVLNKSNQGIKDVVQVGGEESGIWLTSDHKMLIKSPGEGIYRWAKAIRCEITSFKARKFEFIINKKAFYWGLLLGIIESDGYVQEIKTTTGVTYQIKIFQADEVEFIKNTLEYLEISYSLDKARQSPWGKKQGYVFRIKRPNNNKIFEHYKVLKIKGNIDIQKGFLVGFIIGDGWVDNKTYGLHLCQSAKKEKKVNLIDDVLSLLNIKATKSQRWKKLKDDKKIEMVEWYISKYSLPFSAEKCKKTKKWVDHLLSEQCKRIYIPYEDLKLKGFKAKQQVWDLTTTTGNFIVNGFIVHNCIIRSAGMCDFVKNSPAGKVFYDPKEAYRVVNLPQFINPYFTEKQYQDRIKKWGGKESSGFKIYVEGEICEDGENALDMRLVRDLCYPHLPNGELNEKRTVKHIEITKKNYIKFKNYLALLRPLNADSLYVTADIGQKGGITEIILIAGIKEKFRYLYNITLINLTKPQQYDVFKHIVQTVNVDYLSLDSGGGQGEAMYCDMQVDKVFKNVKLIWVAFNENVPVGIDLDDDGKPIKKHGKIQEKMVNAVHQSIDRLCHLFYNALVYLPYDSRLDEQLDKVVSIRSTSTGKVLYRCIARENHLFQSWQVFSIAQWLVEYGKLEKPKNNRNETRDMIGVI